jgi:predicted MFS family arabinose efflux permease
MQTVMKLTTFKVLGPIIGGFVSESIGWRWTFWIITILVSRTPPLLFSSR